MTINTERLKTDAAYWDECGAPDDVTHYCELAKSFLIADDDCICTKCIPRPTKPAAPEWVDGLPPVGTVCECLFNDGWCKVAVLAHYKNESWVKRPRGTHIVSEGLGNKFRPIRTKEQRQREDILEILYMDEPVEVIADAILSRYNLEPKP